MSTPNTSPIKPAAFDGSKLFGPYPSDITESMKMPNNIVMSNFKSSENPPDKVNDFLMMQVPERIVVVGNDKVVSEPEPPPEMRQDNLFLNFRHDGIYLPTPPSTLTLDEYRFYSDEKIPSRRSLFNEGSFNDDNVMTSKNFNDSTPGFGNTSLSSPDDIIFLKRHIKSLSRRLALVEIENQQRYQRDLIFFALGAIYFSIKFFIWLKRH